MADPKGTYNNPGNTGLATAMTGTWQPAFMVSQNQHKEAELKKKQEAANQQKAEESNEKFGDNLFDFEKNLKTFDTQRNDYKYSQLTGMKDAYYETLMKASEEGRPLNIQEKRQLQGIVSEGRKNIEQTEATFNFTNGILEQAKDDGFWNYGKLQEVIFDLSEEGESLVDFSKVTEKDVEKLIKKNALSVLNAGDVAKNFSETISKQIVSNESRLSNGQTKKTTIEGSGLKVFTLPDGTTSNKNPETGRAEMDDSPEALSLARDHEYMNMLIEAKVEAGEADTPLQAYKQLMHNRNDISLKEDIQGTRDKSGGSGSGKSSANGNTDLVFDAIGFRRPMDETAIHAWVDDKSVLDARYVDGPPAPMYEPGTEEYNKQVQDMSLGGRRFVPGQRSPEFVELDVVVGEDHDKNPIVKTLRFDISNEESQKKSARVMENIRTNSSRFKEGTINQSQLHERIKEIEKEYYQNKSGIFGNNSNNKPKSGIF